jgi:hypothetical protein
MEGVRTGRGASQGGGGTQGGGADREGEQTGRGGGHSGDQVVFTSPVRSSF